MTIIKRNKGNISLMLQCSGLPQAQYKQRPPEHVNTGMKTDVKNRTCATEFARVQKARPFGAGQGRRRTPRRERQLLPRRAQ
jgi:hypothetical protein